MEPSIIDRLLEIFDFLDEFDPSNDLSKDVDVHENNDTKSKINNLESSVTKYFKINESCENSRASIFKELKNLYIKGKFEELLKNKLTLTDIVKNLNKSDGVIRNVNLLGNLNEQLILSKQIYSFKLTVTQSVIDIIDRYLSLQDRSENQTTGLKSIYDENKLIKIFNKLMKANLVREVDKNTFLLIFTDHPKGFVFWKTAPTGAKAALFDLIKRITSEEITASKLKLFFRANMSIRDNWKDKGGKSSKLIDELLTGI